MAGRRRSRARTLEGREQQLVSDAYDRAEQQIEDGTVSSQVLTHFLKMGSTRELVEQERMRGEIKLQQARAEQIDSQKKIEELYVEAIKAFGVYSGNEQPELGPGE